MHVNERKGRPEMKWKIFRIMLFVLIFTPVTTLTMLNPPMQHPGKFSSFKQMMRYYRSIEKKGPERHITPTKRGRGKDMSLRACMPLKEAKDHRADTYKASEV